MVALTTDLTGSGLAPQVAALLGENVVTGITATAGGGTGGATLTGTLNIVTVVASAGDSVKLPLIATWQNSQMIIVQNRDASDSMNVFPATANSINGGTVTTGQVAVAAVSTRVFYRVSNTDWASWVAAQ